ncbi:MAG TPA: hypothetical protein VGR54_03985 [Nitrosopumilaceae archaeon]|nr:hypothetical protein [Nitrosopumilaceae archaeon]
MKPLAFVLLVLVGSLILTNLPAPSYADPNLDTLLRIATQARDNINIQLSQLPTIPNEINQLYNQGSEEMDALAQSVSQNDQTSSKEHFLSVMKIFKEVNDKISSLTPITSEQISQTDMLQLKSEINRMKIRGDRLETIATKNNVEIDFTKFNKAMQDAIQNLDAGNADQVKNDLETANRFLLDAHQLLVDAAKKKISDRAKDFTEKQIHRLSHVKETNPLQNVTRSFAPLTTPVPKITNESQTENIPDMIVQLKQLVSEGKIDEAIKLIKLIEALQNQEANSQIRTTETPKATQPANANSVNSPEIIKPVNNSTTVQTNSTTMPNQIPPTPTTPIPPPSNVTTPHTPISNTPPKTNFTESSSTTAPTSSTISLTINSADLSGNKIKGIWIELHNPNGKVLKSGYTPRSFSISSGNQYVIYVSNWQNLVFNHWDNGSTDPFRTITPTHSVTLTAYYSTDSTTSSKTTRDDHEKHHNEGQD